MEVHFGVGLGEVCQGLVRGLGCGLGLGLGLGLLRHMFTLGDELERLAPLSRFADGFLGGGSRR